MPIDKDIFRTLRIVPARFRRATDGNPDPIFPDIDDRGYAAPERGAIVGLTVADAPDDPRNDVFVVVERQDMELGPQLFATSSDASILRITHPASGTALKDAQRATVRLRGIPGGTAARRTAQVQIRLGSVTGPIVAELTAWVLTRLRVRITPHVVTIADPSGTAGVASVANIGAIMPLVQAIWKPCGIDMTVQPTKNWSVNLAVPGVVDSTFAEINQLLTHHVANTINVYMVNQIGLTGQFLGLGLSRAAIQPGGVAAGANKPCIILADTDANGTVRDDMYWANDLAHEVGHFLGLWHPSNLQPPDERQDTWSRRMLMHNHNLMRGRNPWPAFTQNAAGNTVKHRWRPRLNDVGYGNLRRGCLITMKDLDQINTDGECMTARNTISSAAGPY